LGPTWDNSAAGTILAGIAPTPIRILRPVKIS
jgi:hypothetical protein